MCEFFYTKNKHVFLWRFRPDQKEMLIENILDQIKKKMTVLNYADVEIISKQLKFV